MSLYPEHRETFAEGDLALLIDRKGRKYLVTLKAEGAFHSHAGVLPHRALIGARPGCWLKTTQGQTMLAVRPTLADYVTEMPRVTQVVYPKDLGAILVLGDIFPGARVLEAGLGSGALTAAILRAVGPAGHVTTCELRAEGVAKGVRNVETAVGDVSNLTVRTGDVYQGIEERDLDRIILDVPEPWQAVPHAVQALAPSGILLCYLPTVLQVHRLVGELNASGYFQLVDTVEVLLRPWYVTQQSVRPVHRMVAHTAFITTARRCEPRPGFAPAVAAEEEEPAEEEEVKPTSHLTDLPYGVTTGYGAR